MEQRKNPDLAAGNKVTCTEHYQSITGWGPIKSQTLASFAFQQQFFLARAVGTLAIEIVFA